MFNIKNIPEADSMKFLTATKRHQINQELKEHWDDILGEILSCITKIMMHAMECGQKGINLTTIDIGNALPANLRFILFNCTQMLEDVTHVFRDKGYKVSKIDTNGAISSINIDWN